MSSAKKAARRRVPFRSTRRRTIWSIESRLYPVSSSAFARHAIGRVRPRIVVRAVDRFRSTVHAKSHQFFTPSHDIGMIPTRKVDLSRSVKHAACGEARILKSMILKSPMRPCGRMGLVPKRERALFRGGPDVRSRGSLLPLEALALSHCGAPRIGPARTSNSTTSNQSSIA